MQHLISSYREEDVEYEVPTEDLLHRRTEIVDVELADQVREAWDKGEIDDQVAGLAWWLIAFRPLCPRKRPFAEQRVDTCLSLVVAMWSNSSKQPLGK